MNFLTGAKSILPAPVEQIPDNDPNWCKVKLIYWDLLHTAQEESTYSSLLCPGWKIPWDFAHCCKVWFLLANRKLPSKQSLSLSLSISLSLSLSLSIYIYMASNRTVGVHQTV